jgi:hypothetical protein
MRIAIASSTVVPPEFGDDERLAGALRDLDASAEVIPWDSADAPWGEFDLVVIRSTWDYPQRREEFVSWAEAVGDHLHNTAELVRWNSDKRYLADLERAGIRVVPTEYFPPGTEPALPGGEVVVKPTVSAGARDTGRFSQEDSGAARALVATIHGAGKTAMVQPYNPTVDSIGETAVVMIGGRFSHALRKNMVLRPGEVAPVRDDSLGAAEAMYDPRLVALGAATVRELEAAEEVAGELERRFGEVPLYVRVDLVTGADGEPEVMEIEGVEPNLYHGLAPGSEKAFAQAIVERAKRG